MENNILKNIKSKYILKILYEYLSHEKFLTIIKYNKDIQNKLNININTYKEYLQIEIDIIPKEKECGKFINIHKIYKRYFHIYFNNNKEEIKKFSIKEKDKVKNIKIKIDYEIVSLDKLFYECKCIEKINFIKFKRNNITNLSYMFCGCLSLKEINISNFNSNNVTDMSHMFEGCSSLNELNLSNINTNNVTNISFMFRYCWKLSNLSGISKWNTNNVTDMSYMFMYCSELSSLPDLSKWDTTNVTKMDYMFFGCHKLPYLSIISKWNTNNVTDISFNYDKCLKLLSPPDKSKINDEFPLPQGGCCCDNGLFKHEFFNIFNLINK